MTPSLELLLSSTGTPAATNNQRRPDMMGVNTNNPQKEHAMPSFMVKEEPNNLFGQNSGMSMQPPPQFTPAPQNHHNAQDAQLQMQNKREISNTLGTLQKHSILQRQQLEEIRMKQSEVIAVPRKDVFERVYAIQTELHSRIEKEIQTLMQLYHEKLLTIGDLLQWESLMHTLKLQSVQLSLYRQELALLSDGSGLRCCAALVLHEQPPASVIFKGKPSPQAYSVHLLSGVNSNVTFLSKVKAAIVCDSHLYKNKINKRTVTDSEKSMDPQSKRVLFQPRFLVGTRKHAINLRFSVQLQLNAQDNQQGHTVESQLSNPFIVITNECQWSEAEGTLIKKEAFKGHLEVPWALFANTFQLHFVSATRQDLSRPSRVLSGDDLQYLHQRWFGNKSMVTCADFEKFWSWFGKSLHTLRYQRHVGNLWKNGFIYGFLTKDGVGCSLRNAAAGSFVVRWSENHPGSFAVGYKHLDTVKHYLVKADDVSGPKKNLPDFLYECPQFVYILKLSRDSFNQPVLTPYRKEEALDGFIQRKGRASTADGYEELPT
eukprot:TRINITY_DN10846_c0_g1_i1.p1 TRINITY_DN10846_c0_g1~~TRINITY_DN10846_c0_g1_i1.p1  ORF type:complete len:608 (+),score=60.48 TRINITY_DN10846_c0_g1_i1:195-1826(+)